MQMTTTKKSNGLLLSSIDCVFNLQTPKPICKPEDNLQMNEMSLNLERYCKL